MQASVALSALARSSNWKKASIVALVAAVLVAFFYFDLQRFLSLEALKANRDALVAFTESNYPSAVLLFIVLYIIVTAASVPGAVILTLAGGFLFGSVLGTCYVNVGATVGSTLAFLAARYVLRDWVEGKFGERLEAVQEGFRKNGFLYLLTLRLIPVFPFFLVNLVGGLTRVGVGTYVLATAMGILPASFVYAYAGEQLGTINSLAEVASRRVLLALTLLGILALVPLVYQKLTRRS
jgi:uncharacterized membrane protein YdjX (TVP38/TMEM64 family)